MNITVFGGAQPKEGSAAYEQASELGALLAQSGHSVLTGGYMGTMEAVSRGAHEAGGHVIGVTCIDIEEWRKSKPNQWVKEERRKQTLMERLSGLIEGCDAAIALPGGAGTLAEISLMWNLMIVESLPPRLLYWSEAVGSPPSPSSSMSSILTCPYISESCYTLRKM